MQQYQVQFVGDNQLPADHDWMFIRTPTHLWFFVKASKVCPRVLTEAWATYRILEPQGVRISA